MDDHEQAHDLLTPREVASLFKVKPKTVSGWAKSGKRPCIRTAGGHRRFRRSDVERAMAEGQTQARES